MPDLDSLQERLLHRFNNISLLEEALTHPSTGNPKLGEVNYERLEFLGDSVLGLVVTEMLMKSFHDEPEGDLAKRRAALVCREALTQIARQVSLGNHILMTDGEEASGGRENPTNLENVMEAVIGAIYSDGGLPAAKTFIEHYWKPLSQTMKTPPKDPKTALQEWAQGNGKPIPDYEVIKTEGPSHSPLFTIEVNVAGLPTYQASASSKRVAEREAAQRLMDHITSSYL